MDNPPNPSKDEPATGKPPIPNPSTVTASSPPPSPNGGDPKTKAGTHSQLEERTDELSQGLNDLDNEVIVADEWGIFSGRTSGADTQQSPGIYQVLARAHEALAAQKLEEVEITMLDVRALLNHAQDTNREWQMNNRFGLLPILLIVLSALVTYDFAFRMWFGLDGINLVHHAAFAGMVGAVLRSLYWLQFQTSRGLLRPRWFATFIVAPPIGAILGWLVSLLIRTSVQAVTLSKDSVNTDWRTISLLAAFAGFNWEWALGILAEAAQSALARMKEKMPPKTKS
jgi:hypothetical protein